MTRKNSTFYFAERPQGLIVPGKTFKLVESDAPTADDLEDGQVLVEVIYLSVDPGMRSVLYDSRSYVPALALGEKMKGNGIARVLASKSAKAKEGDLVTALTGWTEVAIVGENELQVINLPEGANVTDALGAAGNTGITAYIGLKHIGQPKAGETVVVSGAAGATGIIVGQIAKIHGCRVVGIAGSDDKCRLLVDELGFDVALNYKSPAFREELAKATPKYIDVYWDNVGGEILDECLARAAVHSRFVICGSISIYNSLGAAENKGIRNLIQVLMQRIRMEGFIVFDYRDDYPEARQALGKWLVEGKIKRKETIVKGGIGVVDSTFNDLFAGKNVGKLMVEVKPLQEAH